MGKSLHVLWRYGSYGSGLSKQASSPSCCCCHYINLRVTSCPCPRSCPAVRKLIVPCQKCGTAMGPDIKSSPIGGFLLSGFSVSETILEEGSMDGNHLVITCTLSDNENKIRTHALIDSGATGYSFIDEDFARHHNLPLYKLSTPRSLEVIDGRPISSGTITHIAKAHLSIGSHHEKLPMFVTKLGHYPLILGIPWLRLHDVAIRFASNTVLFDSDFCLRHCTEEPATTTGISSPLPEKPWPSITMINAAAFMSLTRQKFKKKKLQVFSLSLHEINKALKSKDAEGKNIKELLPEEYHDFLPLFSEAIANQLPPHRSYDHEIPLKEGFTPPFGPLYSLSRNELEVLKKWLEENLSKGFIRASSSPAGAPILFAKKGDGSLRLCVDYRGLNAGTIKNRYPLPLIQETLMWLSRARWFTKLDVRGAYNLLRMAEGEEWKTAFRTRYVLFESLVMPFGLTNAPASFQHFINDVFWPFLDIFCSAFIDDILIYSNTLAKHKQHVRQVLTVLSKAGLHLKPEKCEFHCEEVKYLGLIIGRGGARIDPSKVSAILDWETLKNLKDVQAFLGFANFCRRFILSFSKIVAPLMKLTWKNPRFVWSPWCQEAFDNLKNAFTSAPVLRHFDPDQEIVVETDASDYVSAGVLSQHDDNGVLHPVAFFSKKHSPAECNYEIYDKELMAIIRCFEEWRPHLEGAEHPVKVLSDHRNLEYFMTTKLLSRRQARWSEFLSRFNFVVVYRPGKAGGKPDALTRRSGDLPQEGDERLTHQSQTVLKSHNLELLADITPGNVQTHLEELFNKAYETDLFPSEVFKMLKNGTRHCRRISLAECSKVGNCLYYRDHLYVPDYDELRLFLLQSHHASPAAGHPGRSKTLELLSRMYYWPRMRKDVERFVRNCHICQRSRTSRHAPFGVLRPMPIPDRPWQDISMDFITGLPWSEGKDAIWVVVDRLTKMRHFVACRTNITAEDLADLFLENVWRLHGLPGSIVSD